MTLGAGSKPVGAMEKTVAVGLRVAIDRDGPGVDNDGVIDGAYEEFPEEEVGAFDSDGAAEVVDP